MIIENLQNSVLKCKISDIPCFYSKNMRIGLLVLVGLPGSGKTTLAKNLINNFKHFEGNIYNFIHVCYDDLMLSPNGNYLLEWKSARNSVLTKIESLIQALKNKRIDLSPPEFNHVLKYFEYWDGNFVLIIDDNMYFRSMRYSLFQIAKRHGISFCQVYFNCSLENALLNNSLRAPDAAVPSEVITNMNSKIEPPNCKNNWEKFSIELNMYNLDDIHYKLFPVLNTSLSNFFISKDLNDQDKELSKIQCKKSILHQSDIALRRIISCKIKNYFHENPKESSKDFIAALNLRKFELLFDIKVGNVCLPEEILQEINCDVLEKNQLINFLGSYF